MNESMTKAQAADILEKRMNRYHPNDDITKATQIAIGALHYLQPANEPLTLEELWKMDKPVWCACDTFDGKDGYWCLCQNGIITPPSCVTFEVGERPNWTFYRRKPEGSDEHC